MLVKDLMTTAVTSVPPGSPAAAVIKIMRSEDVGIVPVCDIQGHLLGGITDRDILIRDGLDKNVDEIIRNVKRNNYHKKIEQLIQQQKKLEISLNDKSIDKDTMKEVELEIMNITLKIIDIQKSLKSL